MPDNTPFLVQPPFQIQQEVARRAALAGQLALINRWNDSFNEYSRVYEFQLHEQPPHQRFHKGMSLANMGWVRFRQDAPVEGARWTLFAFIEDALSRAEESPDLLDELSRPAAQNLRLLGFTEAALVDLASRFRVWVHRRDEARDPSRVFAGEDLDVWLRQLNLIRGTGETIRVFASSPSELRRERLIVAEVCRQLSTTLPVRMEALLWEGGAPTNPEAASFPASITGGGAQGVIDEYIWHQLGGYDVYVGLLWRRMGTATPPWRSGTEAEFRLALERRATEGRPEHILFYQKRAATRRVDADVADFTSELRTLGLLHRFNSGADFRRMIFDHLAAIAHQRLARRGSA